MTKPTVFPALHYDDARQAVDFLKSAFGAEEHSVFTDDAGNIRHAELSFGNGIVMFGPTPPDEKAVRTSIYVVIDDVDAHAERARANGAEIMREPNDTDYGSREYGARDPEGNTWHFGTYTPYQESR